MIRSKAKANGNGMTVGIVAKRKSGKDRLSLYEKAPLLSLMCSSPSRGSVKSTPLLTRLSSGCAWRRVPPQREGPLSGGRKIEPDRVSQFWPLGQFCIDTNF